QHNVPRLLFTACEVYYAHSITHSLNTVITKDQVRKSLPFTRPTTQPSPPGTATEAPYRTVRRIHWRSTRDRQGRRRDAAIEPFLPASSGWTQPLAEPKLGKRLQGHRPVGTSASLVA